MVNFPKIAHLYGNFSKKIMFSWEIFTYGNISVALMIKIPLLLRNFFFHLLDTITQLVLGKFSIKVKISMTISNSVGIQVIAVLMGRHQLSMTLHARWMPGH
jgi:hypothetical protein